MQLRVARSCRHVFGAIGLAGLVALGLLLSSSHVHAHHEMGSAEECVACTSANPEDLLTSEQVSDMDWHPISESHEIDNATLEVDHPQAYTEPARGPPSSD